MSDPNRDVIHTINHLLHLGYDLIGAYELALDRIENRAVVESLGVLRDSHQSMIDKLSDVVRALGVEPTHQGDLRALLENVRVRIAQREGDRKILEAMAANEAGLVEEYRKALTLPDLPDDLRELLESATHDEDRHTAFYQRMIEGFES